MDPAHPFFECFHKLYFYRHKVEYLEPACSDKKQMFLPKGNTWLLLTDIGDWRLVVCLRAVSPPSSVLGPQRKDGLETRGGRPQFRHIMLREIWSHLHEWEQNWVKKQSQTSGTNSEKNYTLELYQGRKKFRLWTWTPTISASWHRAPAVCHRLPLCRYDP